jgi:hypothetical protein
MKERRPALSNYVLTCRPSGVRGHSYPLRFLSPLVILNSLQEVTLGGHGPAKCLSRKPAVAVMTCSRNRASSASDWPGSPMTVAAVLPGAGNHRTIIDVSQSFAMLASHGPRVHLRECFSATTASYGRHEVAFLRR